jgi:hypothetical protein
MNVALPAVMIVLGLLPGIVFFKGYFSGRFSKRFAAISGVSELALYIVFAVPLDWVALLLANLLGLNVDFTLAARLLLGINTEQTAAALARTIGETWGVTAPAYFGVLAGAFLLGNLVRKTVWALRLDARVPFFRMRHEWYYLLQGRASTLPRQVIPYADVLIEEPGGTKLYQGIVSSFEVDERGNVSQLILREAYRGLHGPRPTQFKPIPGDRFVVMGTAIRSINMRYIIPTPLPRLRWSTPIKKLRHGLKRFFWEEP